MQLVYLVDAEKPPKMEKTAQNAAQAAHLKRLEEFWTSRKAVLIGPLADAGRTKGIVLFDLPKASEAIDLMNDDPWVKAGQLKPELRTVTVPVGVIHKGPKFMDLDSLWFCEVIETNTGSRRAPTDHSRLLGEHNQYMEKSLPTVQISLRCLFASGDDHREFLVLRGKDKGSVESALNGDPAVAAGLLQIELHPLFVSKGTFTPASM